MGEFTSTSSSSSSIMGDSASMPALGMAWSYCVNAKISLHRNSAAIRIASTVVEDSNGGSDGEGKRDHSDVTDSSNKPSLRYGGGGSYGNTSAGTLGQKRFIHDTVYPTHHYGKHADFCYDTSNESALRHTSESTLYSTYPPKTAHTSANNISSANTLSNNSSTKENISSNQLTIAYISHTTLPKLHEYITYYPTQPISHSTNVADNNAFVPTDVNISGKSTRYIRLDSSVYKARDSCRYEISHMGVFGVDE